MRKHIPFNKQEILEEANKDVNTKTKLTDLSIKFSIESSKLLKAAHAKILDEKTIREIAVDLKKQLDEIVSSIPEESRPLMFTGQTNSNYFKAAEVAEITEKELNRERVLNNGGMAPPKDWKSIVDMSLKPGEKDVILQEMRKLRAQGKTVSISGHKPVFTMAEFIEPFKYIDNDYDGPFLSSLLKTTAEIDNISSSLSMDLSKEKQKCEKGECILISIYDISGSHGVDEKKFILIVNFDQLNGILKYDYPIFVGNKKANLSMRQKFEIEKFLKTKKITI